MRAAVALLALCALLLGAAPYAPAEDDAESTTGAAKGTAGGPAPRSAGSPNLPAANSAPGDDSEPERDDALSLPDADPHVQDPDETAPFGARGARRTISPCFLHPRAAAPVRTTIRTPSTPTTPTRTKATRTSRAIEGPRSAPRT